MGDPTNDVMADARALSEDLGQQARVPGLEPDALLDAANRLLSADTGPGVVEALDQNLQLWVAIRTAAGDLPLPEPVRSNLRALATAVTDLTLAAGQRALEVREIEQLARINLDIAQGLAEGNRQRLIRERAYELWEQAGRPDGRAMDFWLAAETEVDTPVGR